MKIQRSLPFVTLVPGTNEPFYPVYCRFFRKAGYQDECSELVVLVPSGDGKIDLDEFIQTVAPPGYNLSAYPDVIDGMKRTSLVMVRATEAVLDEAESWPGWSGGRCG